VKVPCGKNVETGERIFVSDVSPGECILPRVICPVCETPLQAKKGHQTIHHFAHMPVTGPERKSGESVNHHKTSSCSSSYESHIHILAKNILIEKKRLLLPKTDFVSMLRNMVQNRRRRSLSIAESLNLVNRDQTLVSFFSVCFKQSDGLTRFKHWVSFDSMELEKTIKPNVESKKGYFRADIVGSLKGNTGVNHNLIIEIAVTNKVNWYKGRKIKDAQTSALEIIVDKNKVKTFENENQWINYVVETAPRRWIFNSKQEALRKDFAAYLAKGQRKKVHFSRKEEQVLEDVIRKQQKKLERLGVTSQRVEDYLKV